MPTNKLSPVIQALCLVLLLLMFGGVLFLPGFRDSFRVDADTKQTLFNLVTAVVFFFIGKNTDSANRDAQITTAALAPVPPPVVVPIPPTVPAAPVKIDDSTPVKVEETKT